MRLFRKRTGKRPQVRKQVAKKAEFSIPNVRKMFEHSEAWFDGRHVTIPSDPRLLQKLGIEKGSKILVFAGYSGDWARALAKQSEVHYTDVSKEMTDSVKYKKRGKIALFSTRDALFSHETPLKYDWSFSFEPFPLHWTGSIHIALVRSLLNGKGAKLVYSSPQRPIYKDTKLIARIYGAKASFRRQLIVGRRGWDTRRQAVERIEHHVITLMTSPQARKKAYIDLKVLRELKDVSEISLNELIERKAIKELKITPEQLEESLHRIQELTSLIHPMTRKKVSIKS